ncbi:MAG: hypothetical protein JJ895_11215 [Balneolaceae bacterium]|nr:hypothetical protein [Balneolaceae bacterium]
MNKRTLVIGGVILAAALSRLIPHPLNFAPLGAMSLLGAAYLSDKKFAFIFPMVAYFVTDLFINNIVYGAYYGGFTLFTPGFGWIYGAIAAIVLIGFVVLKKVTLPRVIGSSLLASIAFFVISNFGVWLSDPDYPLNAAGLILCYEMALPFFKNTVMGDLAYSAILFGGFEFALSKTTVLQKA